MNEEDTTYEESKCKYSINQSLIVNGKYTDGVIYEYEHGLGMVGSQWIGLNEDEELIDLVDGEKLEYDY